MVGDRDTATFRRLWQKVGRPDCAYYTDNWTSYAEVIPPRQHIVGKDGTQRIESDNSNTRHRVGRFTRHTKVVSRSERMIDLTMRLWVYFEDPANFARYQKRFITILS